MLSSVKSVLQAACSSRTVAPGLVPRSVSTCSGNGAMAVKVDVKEVARDAPFLPRSGACAAPLPAGHAHAAVMIGGYVEATDKKRHGTAEAWAYERGAGGVGGWSLVPAEPGAPAPGPRIASQAVLAGDSVWLIGGWDPSQQGPAAFLDDVWKLDTKTWAWTKVEVQGADAFGGGVSRFQAAAVGNVIYIHTHRCSDHILALDTAASPPALTKVPVTGDPAAGVPSARGLHSVTKVGGGLMLFAGAPQSGPMMSDLWRLDLGTFAWRRLSPGGPQPHVRCSQIAAAAGEDKLLIVGGAFYGPSGGLEMLGDAFLYDSAANEWREVAAAPGGAALPSPRNAAVGAALLGGEEGKLELFIHGGWRAFVETYSDSFLITL